MQKHDPLLAIDFGFFDVDPIVKTIEYLPIMRDVIAIFHGDQCYVVALTATWFMMFGLGDVK
ncbi:hypothetical protein [Burkholderia pseudomallei]|uniref:hypothetical protein n=1 Tax=Burkholderia pseudomallei TaxID=28450 RepID=UPI0009777A71|nr:hypothetical protein [Burkholderia pseudomallei]